MVGLSLFRSSHRLFPQIGAEIVDQIGQMLPVEGPDQLALEGGQKRQLQAEPGVLAALNLSGVGESLRRLVYLAQHGCPAIGAGHMENGKVLL